MFCLLDVNAKAWLTNCLVTKYHIHYVWKNTTIAMLKTFEMMKI